MSRPVTYSRSNVSPMNDHTRTYEGRRVPRQQEEIVDQGLGFDVGTLFSRRGALRALGIGATGAVAAACSAGGGGTSASAVGTTATPSASSASSSLSEIPEVTAGPYPADGSNGPDILERSGIVRSDIRSSFGGADGTAQGVPMTLELRIVDLADGGTPFSGVAVYVWHCDRAGRYSMYSEQVKNENYLRGVQIADSDGRVRFTSIFPACYTGRWPHIHFEVYPDKGSITDAGNAIATSQVALPKNVCDAVYEQQGYEESVSNLANVSLQSDMVFSDDGGKSQLATVTGDVRSGYDVALTVGVDTTTEPSSGAPSGNGGAPMPGGPGAPPSGMPSGMPPPSR